MLVAVVEVVVNAGPAEFSYAARTRRNELVKLVLSVFIWVFLLRFAAPYIVAYIHPQSKSENDGEKINSKNKQDIKTQKTREAGGIKTARKNQARSPDALVPYSGGAQGPSPLATRRAISSYHSSLDRPRRNATMIMVMLSQPTPPVSELEARQLSIMFSQILSRPCFAAMPRRTNSTTAWDDWQSQMPWKTSQPPASPHRKMLSWVLTVAGENEKLVVVGQIVRLDVGEGRHDLGLGRELGTLLELKVSNGPGEGQVAVDAAEIDKASGGVDAVLLS